MQDTTIFYPLKGFEESYEINKLGQIKSLPRKRRIGLNFREIPSKLMSPVMSPFGYYRIALTKDFKNKLYFVHRLIAINFIPNPENKPHINHKNSKRNDNRIENLE